MLNASVISGLIIGCVLSVFWPFIKTLLQQIEETGSTENLPKFNFGYLASAIGLILELLILMLTNHEFYLNLMSVDFWTAIMLAYGGTIFSKDGFKVVSVGFKILKKLSL